MLTQANARKYVDKDAQGFVDYREMFDKLAGKLDAVVISTPDHSHFAAAMCALKHGIPIYLEKPMCHNIRQIRELTKFAEEKGLATQMGNMVHSGDGIRYTKEWIASGLIGKVRKVIMWTTRPVGGCNRPTMAYKSWPSEPVPPTLDWDKWLNVADWGPFSSEIVPLNWRRVYKYGTGALGDIGTHILDVPMFALDLDYPTKSHHVKQAVQKFLSQNKTISLITSIIVIKAKRLKSTGIADSLSLIKMANGSPTLTKTSCSHCQKNLPIQAEAIKTFQLLTVCLLSAMKACFTRQKCTLLGSRLFCQKQRPHSQKIFHLQNLALSMVTIERILWKQSVEISKRQLQTFQIWQN